MPITHQRKLIRDAVVAALLAGNTGAGSRVFRTRLDPFRRAELPALAVYTSSESVESDSASTAPRILDRRMQLEIVIAVEPGSNEDDAIDAMCVDIERVMHADPMFAGLCRDSLLSSTDIVIDNSGDTPIGLAKLVYAFRYFTDAPDAADVTNLVDLDSVVATTNLGNAQPSTAQVLVGALDITVGGTPGFTCSDATGVLVGDTIQQGANSAVVTARIGNVITTDAASFSWVAGLATVQRALGDQAQDVVSNLENT